MENNKLMVEFDKNELSILIGCVTSMCDKVRKSMTDLIYDQCAYATLQSHTDRLHDLVTKLSETLYRED